MGNCLKCCCIDHKKRNDTSTDKSRNSRTASDNDESKSADDVHVNHSDQSNSTTMNRLDFKTVISADSEITDNTQQEKAKEREAKDKRNDHKQVDTVSMDAQSLVSSTVLDNASSDLRSANSSDLRSVNSCDNISRDLVSMQSMSLQSFGSTSIAKTPTSMDLESERSMKHRVKLNPVGRVVKAPNDARARKARKSHKRDASAAKPDKRRRESVHETIHNIGGHIIDKKTGKQVYVKPNSEFSLEESHSLSHDI